MFTCLPSAGPIQLWQFLLELLRDSERSNCIRWTGNSREFQLCDPREVREPPRRAESRPGLRPFHLARPFCLPSSWPRPQLVLLSPCRELPRLTGVQNLPETAPPAPRVSCRAPLTPALSD